MDIINNKKSKSTIFILPLLYPGIQFTDVLTDNFINCFISDIRYQDLGNGLVIEFDNDIVRFSIPKDIYKDYKKILQSKYSKISDESKEQILYFWNLDETSYLYSVLYKTNKILDYWSTKTEKQIHASSEKEYWPKLNIYEETRGMGSLYKMFNFNLTKND